MKAAFSWVRGGVSIQTAMDDVPIINWTGAANRLKSPAIGTKPQIKISIYKGAVKFHSFEIKMVTGKATLMRPVEKTEE
jgi:hypothetical protein